MKKFFIILIIAIVGLSANAQTPAIGNTFVGNNDVSANKKPVNISQQQIKHQELSLNLNNQQEVKNFNSYVNAHKNEIKTNKTAYTIPVVVHIIYNTSTQNISDQRVFEQINRTDSDFAGLSLHSMGAFPDSLKANTGITFCLASVDPNGNATNGITRTHTTVTSFSPTGGYASCTGYPERCSASGGVDAWDVTKYLNIWVCNMGNGLDGISEFPSGTLNNFYGTTIHYQFFGLGGATAPYNEGATLTHELGHCLNLYHLGTDNTCADADYCPDTPAEYGTDSTISGGCVIDLCNTTCPGIMYMNFMSYSDDAVMANFTPDQAARMQACISNYLMNVVNNATSICGTSGIQEQYSNYSVKIYPNPMTDILTIESLSQTTIKIINIQGQTIMQQKLKQGKTDFDIRGLAKGVYVLSLSSNDKSEVTRIIKE